MLNIRTKHLLMVLLMQTLGLVYFLWYLSAYGYLPSPFVADKGDTFMDLFQPMYWAQKDGRYTEWGSVYPPLNFLLLQVANAFNQGQAVLQNPFELREAGLHVILVWLFVYFLIPALMVRSTIWKVFSSKQRVLFYLIIVLCAPMLFALERGNLLILCLLVLPLYLESAGWRRDLCLALLINLKPYFALLLLIPLIRSNRRQFFKQVTWAGLLFMASGILIRDPTFLLFFSNLFSFSSQPVLQLRDILAMPSSISFISSIVRDFHANNADFFVLLAMTKFVVFIVESIKWGIIFWAIWAVSKTHQHFTDQQITALVIAIITNLGVSVGGYTLIFYIAVLPVLLCMRNSRFYAGLLLGMILPFDFIPVIVHSLGPSYSYITNSTVDLNWSFTLSSVARPFINFILLAVMAREFWTSTPSSSSKPTGTPCMTLG